MEPSQDTLDARLKPRYLRLEARVSRYGSSYDPGFGAGIIVHARLYIPFISSKTSIRNIHCRTPTRSYMK